MIDQKFIGAPVHLFFDDAPGRRAAVRRVACSFWAVVLPSGAIFGDQ